jgi:hypothetical protein
LAPFGRPIFNTKRAAQEKNTWGIDLKKVKLVYTMLTSTYQLEGSCGKNIKTTGLSGERERAA